MKLHAILLLAILGSCSAPQLKLPFEESEVPRLKVMAMNEFKYTIYHRDVFDVKVYLGDTKEIIRRKLERLVNDRIIERNQYHVIKIYGHLGEVDRLYPLFEATFGPNGEWGDIEDMDRTELFELVFTREDFGQLQRAANLSEK